MAIVFTDENIKTIKEKYSPSDSIKVATIYDVAIAERNKKWRDRIEEIICIVPPDKLKKVITKLLSKEIFVQTYFELETGAYFKDNGFNLEYGKRINGKTPDWIIKKGSSVFVVEVFTVFDCEEDQVKLSNTIHNFVKSGTDISEGVVIYPPQDKVRLRILDKYEKYKNLKIPIILACYDQSNSGIDDYVINNILYGDASFNVLTEFNKGVVATSSWYRKANGVFTQATENLSAVIIFKKSKDLIQQTIYSNHSANIKYPFEE